MKGMFSKLGRIWGNQVTKRGQCGWSLWTRKGYQRMKLEESRGHHGGRGKKLDFILSTVQYLKLKPHFITRTPKKISEIRAHSKEKGRRSVRTTVGSHRDLYSSRSLFTSSFLTQTLLKVK